MGCPRKRSLISGGGTSESRHAHASVFVIGCKQRGRRARRPSGGAACAHCCEQPQEVARLYQLLPKRPNELWQTDVTHILVPRYGRWYAVTVIDYHSRYVLAMHSTHSYSAPEAGRALKMAVEEAERRRGPPAQPVFLVTDNGPSFIAHRFRQMLGDLKINPQTELPKRFPLETRGKTAEPSLRAHGRARVHSMPSFRSIRIRTSHRRLECHWRWSRLRCGRNVAWASCPCLPGCRASPQNCGSRAGKPVPRATSQPALGDEAGGENHALTRWNSVDAEVRIALVHSFWNWYVTTTQTTCSNRRLSQTDGFYYGFTRQFPTLVLENLSRTCGDNTRHG
jgi:hypothetical protein